MPVVNNPSCGDIAKCTAHDIFGGDNVISMKPEMTSESFSAAQKLYPGIYAFIGVRNDCVGTGGELHSPEFDIDEKALLFGAAFESKYAMDFIDSRCEIEFEEYNGSPDELYKEICYEVK